MACRLIEVKPFLWNKDDLLSIGHFGKISMEILTSSFTKCLENVVCKMAAILPRPQYRQFGIGITSGILEVADVKGMMHA